MNVREMFVVGAVMALAGIGVKLAIRKFAPKEWTEIRSLAA